METMIREPEGAKGTPEPKPMTRDEFLDAVKPQTQTFNVAELGGKLVTIRNMTLADREEILSGSKRGLTAQLDEASFISLTVLRGLVEPKLTIQDIAALKGGNFGALKAISERIWNISGIRAEEAGKNA